MNSHSKSVSDKNYYHKILCGVTAQWTCDMKLCVRLLAVSLHHNSTQLTKQNNFIATKDLALNSPCITRLVVYGLDNL